MRFMILVKASADSEAGIMPSEELITAMGNFNEELVKAGILIDANGLHPSSKGARAFLRRQAHGHRRPVHRNQGAGSRLLDLGSEVEGRSHRMGQTLPEPHAGRL